MYQFFHYSPACGSIRRQQSKAITILEMLVGIVVLLMLAALLASSIQGALESAKAAKCASNMRQIGVAVSLYTGDHDGFFPRGGWGNPGALPLVPPGTDGVGWLTDIWPYVDRNRNLFICPSGSERSPTNAISWMRMPEATWNDPRYPMHYAYNAQLNTNRISFRSNNPPLHVDKITAVRNLAGLPVLIDVVFQNNFYGGITVLFSEDPPPTSGETFATRHRGRGHVLWGDGSVSAMTREEWANAPEKRVSAPTWKRYRFCNGDY